MSWQDSLANVTFQIVTGDGQVWTPDLPQKYQTQKEFEAADFNFIDQPGSLIVRKQPKGRKFPLVFVFQGADCIDQANNFDLAANDNRAWTVTHPFYGTIVGQPTSILRKDDGYNASEITVEFWETISSSFPTQSISIPDGIQSDVNALATISPVDYATKVILKPADINTITTLADQINGQITKVLTASDYTDYTTAVNQMMFAIAGMILAPTDGVEAIHQVLLQPAKFALAVQDRVSLLATVFNSILQVVTDNPTPNNSLLFESMGGVCISSMALAAVNPQDGDLVTRNSIQQIASTITATYQTYLAELDALYINNPNPAIAYSAAQGTQDALQDVYVNVQTGLATLAFSAAQERQVILDQDSNLIVLTHRYMGLDANDINLATFRTINNIKNKSLFLIKKGTLITYYV